MPITNPTVLEDTPTDNELSKAPTSNWAFDHNARDATAAVQGHATAAQITKLDGIAAGAQPGTVTAVSGTSPVTSSGGTTPAIGIPAATAAAAGHATAVQITKLDGIEALADVTDATNVATAGAVMKSLYDAYTILMATDDDTPIPLTVAAQTLIGRITGGTVASLTVAQIKTLLGVAAASGIASLNASTKVVEQPASISDFLDDTAGGTDALTTKAATSNVVYDGLLAKIPKSLLTEQGDVIYASGVATPAALAHGTAKQALLTGGDAANPSWGLTTSIQDADADTKIQTEESADEDKIRMDVKGVEAFLLHDDGILDLVKQSGCSVYRSTNQAIANATATKVQLATEFYDIQGEFDSTTNYRFTAKKAGYYLVAAAVNYVTFPADKKIQLYIQKNATLVAINEVETSIVDYVSAFVLAVIQCAANEYIELYTAHWGGTTYNLRGGAGYTFMNIHKVA